MTPDILFSREKDLGRYLEERKLALKSEIESFPSNYLLNVSEEDLFKCLVDKYVIELPVLQEDKIYIADQSEVDIDVSRRIEFDYGGTVKGLRVAIAIPFTGDSELFQYQPSTYTLNPPKGEVVKEEMHLIYRRADHNEPIPFVKTKKRVVFGVEKPALVLSLNLPLAFLP